jgi:hypothetical protein
MSKMPRCFAMPFLKSSKTSKRFREGGLDPIDSALLGMTFVVPTRFLQSDAQEWLDAVPLLGLFLSYFKDRGNHRPVCRLFETNSVHRVVRDHLRLFLLFPQAV